MTYLQYVVCIAFTWVGFIGAISFMEAWLKFRAAGVTLPIGLSIGRVVFKSLNKVEWVFALVSILLLYLGNGYQSGIFYLFLIAVFVLLLQTFWLLPAMDKRAVKIIAGETLPRSAMHFYYVGGEMIKLTSLIALGMQLLQL